MTLELQGLGRQPANWKSTCQPWKSARFEKTVSRLSFTSFLLWRKLPSSNNECNQLFLTPVGFCLQTISQEKYQTHLET